MIQFAILLLLAFVQAFTGGYLRGLFEVVILFDSVDDWLGSKWSFKLFTSGKDRNRDGRTSFWELNFPSDRGHRAKLVELFLYSVAICLVSLAGTFYTPPIALIVALPFVFWLVISAGFLASFNKYRHAKKPTE